MDIHPVAAQSAAGSHKPLFGVQGCALFSIGGCNVFACDEFGEDFGWFLPI